MDGIRMKWAMVCSVDSESTLPDLRLFGMWLTRLLCSHASVLGLSQCWDDSPDLVLHASPGSRGDAERAYSLIHSRHPDVLMVFHILPTANAPEYSWMKSLAQRYALIRQGVLQENAKSRFAGLSLDVVLGNIVQWIARRLAQLTSSRVPMERGFDLRVGNGDTVLPTGHVQLSAVEILVQSVIHHHANEDASLGKMAVRVQGFPSKWNQWQLASQFSDFLVMQVTMRSRDAIVYFANRFHALQAAINVHAREIDEQHTLDVKPLHVQLIEQVPTVGEH